MKKHGQHNLNCRNFVQLMIVSLMIMNVATAAKDASQPPSTKDEVLHGPGKMKTSNEALLKPEEEYIDLLNACVAKAKAQLTGGEYRISCRDQVAERLFKFLETRKNSTLSLNGNEKKITSTKSDYSDERINNIHPDIVSTVGFFGSKFTCEEDEFLKGSPVPGSLGETYKQNTKYYECSFPI